MNTPLRDLLRRLSCQEISVEEAVRQVRMLSYDQVGQIAKIDPWRADRIGVPEAVLAEGKTEGDLVEIALAHLQAAGSVILTRVSQTQLEALRAARIPEDARLSWSERARIALLRRGERKDLGGRVGVLSAGTADIPVAEEARITAEEMGCQVVSDYDVGVAGIHRLFPTLERMRDMDALVVAAGREGTLPAVVAGLVDSPVIGLPVSTGYGAGGGGQAALFSMLQSCSVLTVVNIDAGFVAGAFAGKIALQRAWERQR